MSINDICNSKAQRILKCLKTTSTIYQYFQLKRIKKRQKMSKNDICNKSTADIECLKTTSTIYPNVCSILPIAVHVLFEGKPSQNRIT